MSRDRGVGGAIESLLMDGRIISIRHVRNDDEQGLLDLHRRASIQSRYYRFFSAGVHPPDRNSQPKKPAVTSSRNTPAASAICLAVIGNRPV